MHYIPCMLYANVTINGRIKRRQEQHDGEKCVRNAIQKNQWKLSACNVLHTHGYPFHQTNEIKCNHSITLCLFNKSKIYNETAVNGIFPSPCRLDSNLAFFACDLSHTTHIHTHTIMHSTYIVKHTKMLWNENLRDKKSTQNTQTMQKSRENFSE